MRNLLYCEVSSITSYLVCKRGALCDNFTLGNLVPKRKKNLLTRHLARNESIEFILRPILGEERVG